VLLLTVVLAAGALIGSVSVRGVGIGPAGALFAGLAASAIDDRLVIPQIIGIVGLSLFTYCVGLAAGPEMARHFRSMIPLLGVVAVVLAALAPVAGLVGHLLGLSRAEIAGLYAGSLTNTPALAAVQELVAPGERGEPVVGYALSYPYGVLAMLAAVVAAWRVVASGDGGVEGGDQLHTLTVRVGEGRSSTVADLQRRMGGQLAVSRVERGGRVWVPTSDDGLEAGDVLAVACPERVADGVIAVLGDRVPTQLVDDRSRLDFRRMVVSNDAIVGRSVAELRLTERHGSTITRVRRGSTDLIAGGDTILEPGDRVRVVGPPKRMALIAAELGDDERRVSEFHPRGFTIGLLLGVLVGLIPIPVPGAGAVELGTAGGPLIVGLLLGWRERTGPLVWQAPHGVSFTLRQVGALLFLGMAGTSGGAALWASLQSGDGFVVIAGGVFLTSLSAVAMLAAGRWLGLGPPGASGLIAGAQTQPAVLAFAAERTGDQRLDLTYALVLPVAMVVKIVAAQLLVLL
jgi:putative transport protein